MVANLDTSKVYLAYMQEIKWRLEETQSRLNLIRTAKAEKARLIDAECCFLQVRFICELIALAALAAHHSYGLNSELLKAWHADDIFFQLEEINPFCFPEPVALTVGKDGIKHFAAAPEREMSRKELGDIYGQVGDALHRGRLKHTLANKTKVYNLDQLNGWVRSIARLLAEHLILFPNEGKALLVNISGPGDEVIVIEGDAGAPVHVSSDPVRKARGQQQPRRPRGGR